MTVAILFVRDKIATVASGPRNDKCDGLISFFSYLLAIYNVILTIGKSKIHNIFRRVCLKRLQSWKNTFVTVKTPSSYARSISQVETRSRHLTTIDNISHNPSEFENAITSARRRATKALFQNSAPVSEAKSEADVETRCHRSWLLPRFILEAGFSCNHDV